MVASQALTAATLRHIGACASGCERMCGPLLFGKDAGVSRLCGLVWEQQGGVGESPELAQQSGSTKQALERVRTW